MVFFSIEFFNKVIHILTHNYLCGYKLSDNVLIALLVTSTANVIGMVVIVLKNLFPEKNKDKKKQSIQADNSTLITNNITNKQQGIV